MRVEFYASDDPTKVVGTAELTGPEVRVASDDQEVRAALERIFRKTPVAVDDASLRSLGTSGPVLLQPGSLSWFRAAAGGRGRAEGLGVRVVSDGGDAMGWDPAGAYVPFWRAIQRTERPAPR